MLVNYELTAPTKDRIKQTLNAASVPIYDWMFETGLHQLDLLLYATLFDMLRHEPLKPQHINLAKVAERLHYNRHSVYIALDNLVEHYFLYRQGERNNTLISLYPFETLDLK